MLLRPGLLTRPLRTPVLYRTLRHVSSAPPLIRIQNGTFYERYPNPDSKVEKDNPPLYPSLNFILPSDTTDDKGAKDADPLQHWAIIGSSERTKLLDILRGQLISIPPNARTYPYLLTDEIAAKDHRLRYPGRAIQYVGFSGEGSQATGGVRGAYLSARYESLREDTDWTLRQYLRGQTSLNPLEGEENGTVRDEAFLEQVIANLRLEQLLDMPVANLSNGQTRRARIAKALLNKPELLLLDDPFSKCITLYLFWSILQHTDNLLQWDSIQLRSRASQFSYTVWRRSARHASYSLYGRRTICRTGSRTSWF